MGFGLAFALMLKHTAVSLPLVILALAGLHWSSATGSPGRIGRSGKARFLDRLRSLALLGVIVPVLHLGPVAVSIAARP